MTRTDQRPATHGEMLAGALLVLLELPILVLALFLARGLFTAGFMGTLLVLVLLATGTAPIVVLVATGGRRVGLAWGVFLMGVVVAVGACGAAIGQYWA